jgi:hypothetical protein
MSACTSNSTSPYVHHPHSTVRGTHLDTVAHKEKQIVALQKVENRVRRQLAGALSRRCDSLMTNDEETLLTEYDFREGDEEEEEEFSCIDEYNSTTFETNPYSDASGSKSDPVASFELSPGRNDYDASHEEYKCDEYSTIGAEEKTRNSNKDKDSDYNMYSSEMNVYDDENFDPAPFPHHNHTDHPSYYNGEDFSLAPMLAEPFCSKQLNRQMSPTQTPDIVRQDSVVSIKSRLDYMRGHQQFAGGKDPPSDKAVKASKSRQADSKVSPVGSNDSSNSQAPSPSRDPSPPPAASHSSHKRNLLAKQIIRRRAINRGVDP